MLEKVATISNYQGLSTDERPYSTPGQIVPAGSYYHVIDTGDELVFFNDGWIQDLRRARAMKLALTLP